LIGFPGDGLPDYLGRKKVVCPRKSFKELGTACWLWRLLRTARVEPKILSRCLLISDNKDREGRLLSTVDRDTVKNRESERAIERASELFEFV